MSDADASKNNSSTSDSKKKDNCKIVIIGLSVGLGLLCLLLLILTIYFGTRQTIEGVKRRLDADSKFLDDIRAHTKDMIRKQFVPTMSPAIPEIVQQIPQQTLYIFAPALEDQKIF